MHELSLAESLLEQLELQAARHGFAQVTRVVLRVGRCSHVSVEALRFCFDAITRDTLANGAVLEVVDQTFQSDQVVQSDQMVRSDHAVRSDLVVDQMPGRHALATEATLAVLLAKTTDLPLASGSLPSDERSRAFDHARKPQDDRPQEHDILLVALEVRDS